MYKDIDELMDVITQSDVFQNYIHSNKGLSDEKTQLLLSRHQQLQDEYMRMKSYQGYTTFDELKQQLKDVKKDMVNNEYVHAYYRDYYCLNELLEAVGQLVFQGISDEISHYGLKL